MPLTPKPALPVPDPREDPRPLAIALMGPTAAGKTALALRWAQELQSEIISVDSALVYRRLDIGSAKPSAAERTLVPHHLIDIRDPHEPYSAADFARDALAAMQALAARGRIPVLVGGTGLYFRALLSGLSAMPDSQPEVRAQVQAEIAQRGLAAMHAELATVDAAAARRIHATDPQRIGRALEVFRQTGKPISEWQAESARAGAFPFRVLKLALVPRDREVLHERIARRFGTMLADGLLDEVRALREDPRLHADLPAIRAVGYRQAWSFLAGETDAATFREQAIAATRQLAKRQLTWLRAESDARFLDPDADAEELEYARQTFVTRP